MSLIVSSTNAKRCVSLHVSSKSFSEFLHNYSSIMGSKSSKQARSNRDMMNYTKITQQAMNGKLSMLIYGFIRTIHTRTSNSIFLLNIGSICYQYYMTPIYIFMYDHHAFHTLDVTIPTSPVLATNIIQTTDKSTSWNKPFDLNCYIPNILNISSLQSLIINSKTNNKNEKYDAILCRAHSKTINSGESSRSFYIFPNKAITIKPQQNQLQQHILLQSATGNRGKLIKYMLFSDDKWGIIATGGALVPIIYRLDLHSIKDCKFIFDEVSNAQNAENVWGTHPGYQCIRYLMLKYLPDKEALFAVECKQEHGASACTKKAPHKSYKDARCGIFDLRSSKWSKCAPFRLSTYLDEDEENFHCGLCYNPCSPNQIYLVSSLGRTAKYDFGKNGWSVLYENVTDFSDMSMRYDMGPIVWSYQYEPHILYCIGGKRRIQKRKLHKKMSSTKLLVSHKQRQSVKEVNEKEFGDEETPKYDLQYKKFDIRACKRQWIDCLDDKNMFKQLDFQCMFV